MTDGQETRIVELTCISCPLGCPLQVETDSEGRVLSVSGNTCKRGEEYGRREVSAPMRTVTSTVRVAGGVPPVISVRTKEDIPKEKIFAVMEEIRRAEARVPVRMGDVIVKDIAETGVDLIATRGTEGDRDG